MTRAASRDFWGKLAIVCSAAAGLGYSLFGPLGVVLWVTLAGLLLWVIGLSARFAPRVAISLLLAGVALRSASTLGWGGADAPDGTRFKVSPIGLSHVLTPRQPVSSTVDCRWYRVTGNARPCALAAGGTSAFRQLLAVYPLLWVGIGTCLIGILLQAWSGSPSRLAQRIVSGVAAMVPALALWLFARSVDRALAELGGLFVGTGGTLGAMQVTAAILLSLAACFVGPSGRSSDWRLANNADLDSSRKASS